MLSKASGASQTYKPTSGGRVLEDPQEPSSKSLSCRGPARDEQQGPKQGRSPRFFLRDSHAPKPSTWGCCQHPGLGYTQTPSVRTPILATDFYPLLCVIRPRDRYRLPQGLPSKMAVRLRFSVRWCIDAPRARTQNLGGLPLSRCSAHLRAAGRQQPDRHEALAPIFWSLVHSQGGSKILTEWP